MISVSEARERVIRRLFRLGHERVPLAEACGRVLAEPARADMDMPPFDKACMDGFAVRSADFADGKATLRVIETVAAGSVATRAVEPGTATAIMTGAPMPEGADAVVMVEKSTRSDDAVELVDAPGPGQHVQPRGDLFGEGDEVLSAGRLIRAQEMAMLATVGHAEVTVYRRPTVFFVSTGDEIVAVDSSPGPGEIRDSNSYSLRGLVEANGGEWAGSTRSTDDRDALGEAFTKGLEADILLVSGGVSAGEYDLVEPVLADLGVELVFDKVALKPGKPAVFGTRGEHLVYGLPGNPVSGMVVFLLFGVPALRYLGGRDDIDLPRLPAILEAPPRARRMGREQYLPARLSVGKGSLRVEQVAWRGSSDMLGVTRCNSLLILPAETDPPAAGDVVDVLVWHDLLA